MSSPTGPSMQAPEHVLRAIMASTQDAIMLKDTEGRVLLANDAAGRILGCKAEELIGRDLSWRFEPEAGAKVLDSDRRVILTGEVFTYESSGRVNDPTRVLQVTKTPWRDDTGTIVGLV